MYYMEKRIGMRFGFLIVFIFNDIQKIFLLAFVYIL